MTGGRGGEGGALQGHVVGITLVGVLCLAFGNPIPDPFSAQNTEYYPSPHPFQIRAWRPLDMIWSLDCRAWPNFVLLPPPKSCARRLRPCPSRAKARRSWCIVDREVNKPQTCQANNNWRESMLLTLGESFISFG